MSNKRKYLGRKISDLGLTLALLDFINDEEVLEKYKKSLALFQKEFRKIDKTARLTKRELSDDFSSGSFDLHLSYLDEIKNRIKPLEESLDRQLVGLDTYKKNTRKFTRKLKKVRAKLDDKSRGIANALIFLTIIEIKNEREDISYREIMEVIFELGVYRSYISKGVDKNDHMFNLNHNKERNTTQLRASINRWKITFRNAELL